jgi:hypothetical protein
MRDAVAILPALRRFRTADEEMRRRMSADMAMNVSDLQALRLLFTAERSDTPASACMLATAWASRPPRPPTCSTG